MPLIDTKHVTALTGRGPGIHTARIEFLQDTIITATNLREFKGSRIEFVSETFHATSEDVYPLNINSDGWFYAPSGSYVEYTYQTKRPLLDDDWDLLVLHVIVVEEDENLLEQVRNASERDTLKLIAAAAWVAVGNAIDSEPPTQRSRPNHGTAESTS